MSLINPNNSKDLQRLSTSVSDSRRRLKPFQDNHRDSMQQAAGHRYGSKSCSMDYTNNLLELAFDIYMQSLMSGEPQAFVSVKRARLKSDAMKMQLAINQLANEICLGETLEEAVRSALFTMGIVKIGISPGNNATSESYRDNPGQPFVHAISLDDLIIDMSAPHVRGVWFIGNLFQVPKQWAQENPLYNKKVRENLSSDEEPRYTEFGSDRSDTIGDEGNYSDESRPQDMTTLAEIWLPREKKVITVPYESASEGGFDKVLNVVDWQGPENGPFRILGFGRVPGKVIPTAPAMFLHDLNRLYNLIWNKLGRQAERQKTILGFQSQSEEDATRVRDSSDGEVVRLNQPGSAAEMRFGGPDNMNMAMGLTSKNEFSWRAGSLDVMGGLSQQGDTLGQERLMSSASSKRLEAMQKRVMKFTADVMRDLAWWLHTDPLIDLPLTRPTVAQGIDIEVRYRPEDMEADFLDFNFEIKPYSTTYTAPGEQLQKIIQYVQGVIGPMMPFMEAQGQTLDMTELNAIAAQYGGLPELDRIIKSAMPRPEEEIVGTPPSKAPFTERTYNRVNRSTASRQGQDQVLANTLASGADVGPGAMNKMAGM